MRAGKKSGIVADTAGEMVVGGWGYHAISMSNWASTVMRMSAMG